jgi:hypothetical protein
MAAMNTERHLQLVGFPADTTSDSLPPGRVPPIDFSSMPPTSLGYLAQGLTDTLHSRIPGRSSPSGVAPVPSTQPMSPACGKWGLHLIAWSPSMEAVA